MNETKKPTLSNRIGGGPDRFELRLEPDGVYRVDGRSIPVADNRAGQARGVDDGKSVVGVKNLSDIPPSLLGGNPTMNVE